MNVPLLDLRAQYRQIREEVEPIVSEIFETQGFVGGPVVQGLESDIAQYLNGTGTAAVASGTDALLLALRASGVGHGDEVITTPFTFFATAGAIANAGGTPVFVDIEPDSFNINPALLENAITSRTKAIVPVHLYGQCANMDAIMAVAQKHGITVIEDAAQALGARYQDKPACSLGHAAAISFYPTKNLGGAGDGGMVAATDDALLDRVRLLAAHGSRDRYIHEVVGTNSRLDALQAGVLRVKLKYLDKWNAARRENAAFYNEALADVPEIVTPVERPDCYHVYHQYVVRVPRRDDAQAFLKERGIGSAVFYPLALHCQECFKYLGYAPDDCPKAVKATEEVLALPVFPELTREQQQYVVDALKDHVR